MAMVNVVLMRAFQAGSWKPKLIGLVQRLVAAQQCAAFIKWTGRTLAMTVP